eukprot:UN02286
MCYEKNVKGKCLPFDVEQYLPRAFRLRSNVVEYVFWVCNFVDVCFGLSEVRNTICMKCFKGDSYFVVLSDRVLLMDDPEQTVQGQMLVLFRELLKANVNRFMIDCPDYEKIL